MNAIPSVCPQCSGRGYVIYSRVGGGRALRQMKCLACGGGGYNMQVSDGYRWNHAGCDHRFSMPDAIADQRPALERAK